ncbi:MAG: zeta toxin family protein, partial [Steroidobacteraceae bacterium]
MLEAAGYPQMAEQQKVWDGTSMFTDFLLGGGFGALAHLQAPGAPQRAAPARIRALNVRAGREAPGAEDAGLTLSLAAADRASAPGVPVDPPSAAAHQAALETATAQLLQGRPVDVAGSGLDAATFARRSEPDLSGAETLLANALKEGGFEAEQARAAGLEEALAARMRGEKPTEPQAPRPVEAAPVDERTGEPPRQVGEPFLVMRAGTSIGLGNRNAGNADAVAAHLARLEDPDRPQPAGRNAAPQYVDVYSVAHGEPPGPYTAYNEGRTFAPETRIGREESRGGVVYSIPETVAPAAEPVLRLPMADLHAALAERGYASFDDAGSRIGGAVIREAIKERLANEAPEAAIPRNPNLTPAQRGIEARFARAVARDYEGMKERYAKLKDSEGGKVLSVDTARELSPDYMKDRTISQAVHEPASWFIKRLYAEKLAQAPGPGEEPMVLWTAGGTGAGKSSAIRNVLGTLAARAQMIYDTNMNGARSAIQKIDQALSAGKHVEITYVHREPVESLTNGALKRAKRQEGEFGSGRTVPINEHVNTHVGANEAIRQIAAHYADDPRVRVRVIDNSRGKAGQRLINLDELPRLDYTRVREQATKALEQARTEGRISEAVYRGFAGEPAEPGAASAAAERQPGATGAAGESNVRPAGTGPGRQPAPERVGGLSNRLERVSTAAGRTIEVRPKIIESADVVTSDQAAYP